MFPSRPLLGNRIRLNWLALVMYGVVALVLATRTLYTAWDDANYIRHFQGEGDQDLPWWQYLIEEPVWKYYASFLGAGLGPEIALRVTILASTFIFLAASAVLARGAWVFVLLAFLVDSALATQMYYNQVRQGFAFSVFLALAAIRVPPYIAALTGSAFHTSLLAIVPCALMAQVTPGRRVLLAGTLAIIFCGVFYLQSKLGTLDLGRRTSTYYTEGTLTLFYYVVMLPLYAVAIAAAAPDRDADRDQRIWYHMALLFTVLALSLTLVHEAAGRLMYLASAMVMIALGRNMHQTRGKVGGVWWLLMLAVIVVNEARKTHFAEESWFGRWAAILLH